jgi:predicted GNAT superfamily acetyltransferase
MAESLEFDSPDPLLFAQMHQSGNYVVGGYADGALVAASIGCFGRRDGNAILHSLLTGVSPLVQDRGVGYALKVHQRAWALERGVGMITWTFDPLLRRNAFFNIAKLGADVAAYVPNLFGPAHGLYARPESDCLRVHWNLEYATSLSAREAASRLTLTLNELLGRGAERVLHLSAGGSLVTDDSRAPVLLCEVPHDVVALRKENPVLATDWQRAVRDVLSPAFAKGYLATGFVQQGWYVLTHAAKRP